MSQNKVLVFGIDGATFDIIRPAIERGKMTNLKKLMDAGASGPLQSTIHPITPMAWTSFATGTNAGKHGIFDFARIDNDRILLNNGCDRRMPAIWTHLTEQQRPSVVVNVPFTYPPEQINGVMVPGFEAPYVTRDVFHPESVYDDLLKEFGHYEFDWTFPIGRKLDVAGYREQCRKTIDHRGETSLHLLKNYPWDFFMVVFSTPDHVQHVFWKMEDGHAAIEDIYDQCDQWLGRYLEAIDDDTTVVIMSDHGFGAIEKIVYLDNWLEQEGFLKRAQPGMKQKVIPALKRTLQRVLPTSLRKRISGRLAGLKGRLEAQQFGGTLDWANTKAFSYGMYGNIYINAKGTWPHGIVEPDQYDAVCQQVIDRLMELGEDVEAHRQLSTLYWKHPDAWPLLKGRLEEMARRIYFQPQPHYMPAYEVQPGDRLEKIASQYDVSWQYLADLNRVEPHRIRVGQKLKVIRGPFSAVVDMSDFQITIHAHGYFVARFPVGIGKDGSTPIGRFNVKEKLEDPTYYGPDGVIANDDPTNPLGERWIDLGDSYGIHGTIEPESIGKAESRGCVRLTNEDVAEVYKLLTVGSEVVIRR